MRRRSRTGSAIAGPPSKKSPAPERVSRLPGRERVSAIADGAPDMGPAGRDAAPASSLPARQGLRDLCGDGESAPTLLWAVRAFPLRQYLAGRSRAVPTPPAPPPGGPDHRALGWRRDPRRASGRAGPRSPSSPPCRALPGVRAGTQSRRAGVELSQRPTRQRQSRHGHGTPRRDDTRHAPPAPHPRPVTRVHRRLRATVSFFGLNLHYLCNGQYAWSHTAAPMLAGTLVTSIGFLPNGFAKSTAGEYTANMFWIVGIALIASWICALVFHAL